MLANLTKACTVDFVPGSLPRGYPINWFPVLLRGSGSKRNPLQNFLKTGTSGAGFVSDTEVGGVRLAS